MKTEVVRNGKTYTLGDKYCIPNGDGTYKYIVTIVGFTSKDIPIIEFKYEGYVSTLVNNSWKLMPKKIKIYVYYHKLTNRYTVFEKFPMVNDTEWILKGEMEIEEEHND